MRTILITGGTGLVGRALVKQLHAKNYRVIILTRSPEKYKSEAKTTYAVWNVKKGIIDLSALQKADGIIHLAGAGVVDKKWTPAYKQEILESRTKSSELIIKTLGNNMNHVKVIVSASATGWYGADKIPGHFFKEDEQPDAHFLGEVCRLWEESITPAERLGIRVCKLRTGIVLSPDGGAYTEFRKPLNFGTAAILGSGKQIVSWIHIDDLCRMYITALENDHLSGSYNAVAPQPVSNKTLTLAIADKVRGKFFLPVHVPEFILKLMMGSRSIEVLKSTTVSAEKTVSTGFTFFYPEIKAAVNAIEKR